MYEECGCLFYKMCGCFLYEECGCLLYGEFFYECLVEWGWLLFFWFEECSWFFNGRRDVWERFLDDESEGFERFERICSVEGVVEGWRRKYEEW